MNQVINLDLAHVLLNFQNKYSLGICLRKMIIGNKIGNMALVKMNMAPILSVSQRGQFLVMIVDSGRLFPVVFETMTASDDG